MALSKSESQPTGITTTYIGLSGLFIDHLAGTITVRMAKYLDAASRQAKKSPVTTQPYCAKGADYATILAAPSLLPAVYAWLKTLPEFSGATDC